METHEVYELAQRLHAEQRTKKGKPYFGHIWKVHEGTKELFLKEHQKYSAGDFERARQVAFLHDAVEDQISEFEFRLYNLDPEVMEAVLILTKREGQSYADYIELVKENKLANLVKRADLEHNSKLSRLAGVCDNPKKCINRHLKYATAYLFLSGAIDDFRLHYALNEVGA